MPVQPQAHLLPDPSAEKFKYSNQPMKLYAICLLKNEVDIIEHSLSHALQWADKVIVFDNGSTDGSWELVNRLRTPKLVPYKREEVVYSDGLRADIFNAFKHELTDKDWWIVQDADEFYAENPRHFLESTKGFFHYVSGKKVDFSFDFELIEGLHFSGLFKEDLHLFDRHSPDAWSEPRLVKHRKLMRWTRETVWPSRMGVDCRQQINIKHYPLRSPQQIKSRWHARQGLANDPSTAHWRTENWRSYYGQKILTQMKFHEGEDVFKKVRIANPYRQNCLVRTLKTILHGSGVFA
jgi:glycosyltransferase involved in cell wall biosynthesis